MLTLSLQLLNAAAALLLGLTALRVSRCLSASGDGQHATWLVTGLGFTLLGATRLPHTAAAAWAFFSGPGTYVYSTYLKWSPAANHAGNVLVIAMGILLLVSLRSRLPARLWPLAMGVLIGALSLGAGAGLVEGPLLSESIHWSALAAFNTISLGVLAVVLLFGFSADAVDRHLWLCLGAYALQQSWNVSLYSALAWVEFPGAWTPSPWMMQAYRVTIYTMMISLVLRRLALARRQLPVPSMLATLVPQQISTLGSHR